MTINKMIHCFSDLHCEFRNPEFINTFISKIVGDKKIVVLAGDIGKVDDSLEIDIFRKVLKSFSESFEKVFYVPGNHEYYGFLERGIEEANKILDNICEETGVINLRRRSYIDENGVLFGGCTLWSSISEKAFFQLNDSRQIYKLQEDYLTEHLKDMNFLNSLDPDKEKIIVTHHLPTFDLIHPRFGNWDNTGFATEIQLPPNTQMWFCGHTHESKVIVKNKCKYVCNPLGYPGENKETHISYSAF